MDDQMKKNKTEIKMQYRVKLHNDFTEPYYSDVKSLCKHISNDEYVVEDLKLFKTILNDLLDSPKKKLTEKDIRKDFDDENRRLPDIKVKTIMEYYNGRYSLMKKINDALDKIDVNKMKMNFPVMMKFNIPFEQNYFSCDNDPIDTMTKQNDAYIEIEIAKTL